MAQVWITEVIWKNHNLSTIGKGVHIHNPCEKGLFISLNYIQLVVLVILTYISPNLFRNFASYSCRWQTWRKKTSILKAIPFEFFSILHYYPRVIFPQFYSLTSTNDFFSIIDWIALNVVSIFVVRIVKTLAHEFFDNVFFGYKLFGEHHYLTIFFFGIFFSSQINILFWENTDSCTE